MADIEVVVKIPEEIYRASQVIDVKHEDVIQIPLEVIANSIPLPKGHGRLIDADALDVGQVVDECGYRCGYKYIMKYELDNASTIIEADSNS